jgi:lysophospholipid acyltransferase (LPLAT)-like uncharacterized protein
MSLSLWKRRTFLAVVPPAARWYLALVWATTRIREVGISEEAFRTLYPPPYVAAFWHSRLLYPAYRFRGPDYAALISSHADGELIARCVEGFGTHCVRGSSLRQGGPALHRAVRLLRDGVSCAVTPDGPVGPAGVAQPGAVALAGLARVPLVPLAYAVRRKLAFSSWDAFQVPLPFNRGVVAIGEPLQVPGDLDSAGLEHYRLELEERLDAVTAQADRLVGS